jgi:hypothetical protein
MSDLDLLASDAERDQAAERLRQAGGEGRLTPEELEQRLGRAFGARTRGELNAVVADLPAPSRRPQAPRSRGPELTAFASTAVLLIAIWALSGMGYFWPAWPILGWGFFVLMPDKAFGACSHGHRRGHRPRSHA